VGQQPMTQPPWNRDQIESLNEFQQSGFMHPFTCPNNHGSNEARTLRATHNGWTCPNCEYTQGWAHDFMADGSWREVHAANAIR
jgi:hypothetical protein